MQKLFEEGQRALPGKKAKPAPAADLKSEKPSRKIDGRQLIIDNAILNPRFKAFILVFVLFLAALQPVRAQIQTYLSMDELPDLSMCLPAPPDTLDSAFALDIQRFYWGKQQRQNPERAAVAVQDADWQMDAMIRIFSVPFGHAITREETPEIYTLLERGVGTIQQIRVRPKAYFARKRPFERLGESLLDERERAELTGEGSYPSGHTIRGWSAAFILTEINPDAAGALFTRAGIYGESRVIAGAHWQSDVDVSARIAAIGYARLQCCDEYRRQVARAKAEFRRISRRAD
ncbi:MAG: phosphatase PAP2 family protein [Bacteroidales bacterium]|nr:phosphatase PAP2 family protein [Bacteroidales bacterium]